MDIIQGKLFCDDRGSVSFINDLDLSKYKRFYLVKNHSQGFIRAWHGHKKESKVVVCLKGCAKIVLVPMDGSSSESKIISSQSPTAVVIPPGYYNGAMTLTQDCILMYLSDKTVEESHGDDYRQPWDFFGEHLWKVEYR